MRAQQAKAAAMFANEMKDAMSDDDEDEEDEDMPRSRKFSMDSTTSAHEGENSNPVCVVCREHANDSSERMGRLLLRIDLLCLIPKRGVV